MSITGRKAWTGWLYQTWDHGPAWKAIVESDSKGMCWAELIDYGTRGDKCVLPTGQHPLDKPPRGEHRHA